MWLKHQNHQPLIQRRTLSMSQLSRLRSSIARIQTSFIDWAKQYPNFETRISKSSSLDNLRDMRFAMGNPKPLPYITSFDEASKDAVATTLENREKALTNILRRPDATLAHPTFDHLLPIHIGAGAAGEDIGQRLWTLKEGSLSWA
jgi:hypothetical protein